MSPTEYNGAAGTIAKLFSYRAEWLREDVFELFTEPTYFPELKTHRPCVLEGGRGTGKTTVLRGLSYEGQFAIAKQDVATFMQESFIGVYHKVNTASVRYLDGPEVDGGTWRRLFGHYMNLVFCNQILQFACWFSNTTGCALLTDATHLRGICRSLNLSPVDSADRLMVEVADALVAFEASMNNVGGSTPPTVSAAGSPIELLCRAILSHSSLRGRQFFLLVDEYENFLDYQQQVVNTLIKHASDSYTFKIGVRELGWRVKTTLNDGEMLISPSDYVLIKIEKRLTGDVFGDFAEEICRQRFERLAGFDPAIGVRDRFPSLSLEEEAELLGVREMAENVRRQLAAHADEMNEDERNYLITASDFEVYFISFLANSHGGSLAEELCSAVGAQKRYRTRINNYGFASLFAIRHGKRGIRKYYCGWDVFLKLASGNIRYLLELVENCLLHNLRLNESPNTPVSPATQTKIAQSIGQKNLDELEGVPRGPELVKLLLGLGRIFQIMAEEPAGHAPEVNQFTFGSAAALTRSRSESRERIDALVKSCVMHLALVRSVSNKLGMGSARAFDYCLHPVFSPFFGYSFRKKRKLVLAPEDFLLLIDDPQRAVNGVLAGQNRSTRADLPDQLLLFSEFFRDDD